MNTLTPNTILEKIAKENIKPTARWYFVLRHAILWVPGVLVTLLGAHAVAGLLYASQHSGWEYREFLYPSQKDFFVEAIPFIWIASLALFGVLIVKALRTTSFGYRFSLKNIVVGSFLSSVLLGGFIYSMNELFEADNIIRYPVLMNSQRIWTSPEVGRLSGIIEKIEDDRIIVRDKNDIIWDIDMRGFGTRTFAFVEEGKSVRILGTSTTIARDDEHNFIACALFPWEMGGFNRRPLLQAKVNTRPPQMTRTPNSNPDCETVLRELREHVRRGERK